MILYTVYVIFSNSNTFDVAMGCNWFEAVDEARGILGTDQGAEFAGLYIVAESTREIVAVSMGNELFHMTEHCIIQDY